MHIIILAGGCSKRLFPLTSKDFPKQFLKVHHPYSLLEDTLLRALATPDVQSVTVLTTKNYEGKCSCIVHAFSKRYQHIPLFLAVEPANISTTLSYGYAAYFLKHHVKTSCNATVVFMPSDHIVNLDSWVASIHRLPKKLDAIYCFCTAVKTFSEEFGYLVTSNSQQPASFLEKPDKKAYLEACKRGTVLCNSGIFAMTLGYLIKALDQKEKVYQKIVNKQYDKIPKLSFEKSILMKGDVTKALYVDLKWHDVGTFANLPSLVIEQSVSLRAKTKHLGPRQSELKKLLYVSPYGLILKQDGTLSRINFSSLCSVI